MTRYQAPFTPSQTRALALMSAIHRGEMTTAASILEDTNSVHALKVLAIHVATIAARGDKPHLWDAYLDVLAADETNAAFSPAPPGDDDDTE